MWIYVIWSFVILNVYSRQSVYCVKDHLFYPIIDRITNELKPFQLILFINNASTFNRIVCQRILREIPAVTIDLSKILDNNLLLTLPVLQHPTSSSVFLIIESQDDQGIHLHNIKNILSTIIQSSPIFKRPKILVLHQTNNISINNDLKSILTYAWSLKFLDFTFLIVSPDGSPTALSYNPFSKQLLEANASLQLFPDKLTNLHGYPLKVPVIELPPYLYVKRNSEGEMIDLDGMSYQYCKILSNALNFTIEWVFGVEDSVLRADFDSLFKKLLTGEIDVLTFPFNVRSIMYDFKDWLLMGKLFLNTNYVLVVPVMSLLKVDIPLEVVVFVPLLLFIIAIYRALTKLLHFPRKHWRVFKIFQILLGVTVIREPPRKLAEKIMYLSLILLSMKYSIDTLTKIMDIKLLKGEVAFDTLSEILESNLPIYTLSFIIDHVYENNDDEVMKKLRRQTEAVSDIYQCVYQVVQNKSCICVTPHSAGAYIAKQYINADGTPNTKVARPSLYEDMAAFGFKRASPFVRRFDRVLQMIVESGISDNWMAARKYTVKAEDYERSKPISENIFILQLYAILSIGYIVASFVFAVEVIWRRSRRLCS